MKWLAAYGTRSVIVEADTAQAAWDSIAQRLPAGDLAFDEIRVRPATPADIDKFDEIHAATDAYASRRSWR